MIAQAIQDRLTEGWPRHEIAELYEVTDADVIEVERDDSVKPGPGIVEGAESDARKAGTSLAEIQSREELPDELAEELKAAEERAKG